MYIYCVYPAILKDTTQRSNCLKIAATSVVLIVFNGVICDVSAYILLAFLCVALYESGTKNALLD